MKKPSDDLQREQLRQRIIGLGERSLKKSYYPELQKQIRELEKTNEELKKQIAKRKKSEAIRTKLESQLRQAQKMEAIGSLAGGIAHDFNNILSAIIGYTELAGIHLQQYDKSKKPTVTHDLEGILRSADRAKQLVQQILSFSSKKTGELAPVDIKSLIVETSKMLRALIPTTISIEHDFQIANSTILADEIQLSQVIMNLGTNAYQAMRNTGGTLLFELMETAIQHDDIFYSHLGLRPGPYIILRVTDTGCGMNKKTVDKIFDPYFSTKRKEGGTGLGLSVVHGIITQHKGHISVYSEPGKGSTFWIYLPTMQNTEISDNPTEESAKLQIGSERILVVDDEVQILEILKGLLGNLHYVVTTSSSPDEALSIFCNAPESFDLLITDMNMPNMNGAELIKSVRQICPEIPVILCTGFSEFMNTENTEALGLSRYLMKPVTLKQLNTAIRGLLDT
ncbi:hybrid sensor histidine kinase/response regulator [Desulfosediminicola flagellatus]|uniref:hybrid sensor histidine kinase/response regulator n=1 Tax=Desulfosediminicola flagellatus TaxID=2569541 RepID=UPI0010AB69DA|nr:ATP-binding protein [Desulfosediminicola flagellatus]